LYLAAAADAEAVIDDDKLDESNGGGVGVNLRLLPPNLIRD
jgi:hypothetical protein